MIALEKLRKTYGKALAVDGVSFAAPNGVVTGLLGPNGAGKTTALRAITGIVKPDGGTASVDGCDVQQDPLAARARLGVLPEAMGLYDHLTVREHLTYSGGLHGLSGRDFEARVERLLEELCLLPLADGVTLARRR